MHEADCPCVTGDIRAISYLGRDDCAFDHPSLSNTEMSLSAVSQAGRSFPLCTGNALAFRLRVPRRTSEMQRGNRSLQHLCHLPM